MSAAADATHDAGWNLHCAPTGARLWALVLDDLPVEAVNVNHDVCGWALADMAKHPDRWSLELRALFAEVHEETERNLAARAVQPTPTRMRSDLDLIRSRIDLAGYVARCDARVCFEARRNGQRWASCPFHQEKTPSFVVYPDEHFNCYGCGANGDVFTFHQRWYGTDFRRAIDELSWEAGVEPTPTSCPAIDRALIPIRGGGRRGR